MATGQFPTRSAVVFGPAVGALGFEYAKDPDFERALKAGVGAIVGFVAGSVLKVTMAFALIGLVALSYLFR